MTVHQTGYNYHPNDRVWYFDQSENTFTEGSCYQVEIKLHKKADDTIEKKLTYLVALDNSLVSSRLKENDLYMSTSGGLVHGPLIPIYSANYEFEPNEAVWVVDRVNNGVRYGTVYQTEIKIHKDSDLTSHEKIVYHVQFSDNSGTTIAPQANVFGTSNEAWAALGIVIGPTPTPLPDDVDAEANVHFVSKTSSDTISLPKGTPVYLKSDGTIARVSNDVTLLNFLGLVYDNSITVGGTGRVVTSGVITLVDWAPLSDDNTQLEDSERYYVSSLGKISKTAPSTGYSKQIGLATDDTELVIRPMPTIKL